MLSTITVQSNLDNSNSIGSAYSFELCIVQVMNCLSYGGYALWNSPCRGKQDKEVKKENSSYREKINIALAVKGLAGPSRGS